MLIYFGETSLVLLISRFLSGFAGGGSMLVIPITVSEIADTNIRGTLGSFLIFYHNAGIAFGYVICSYTSYFTVPWISIALSTVFIICYSIVPETPKYLILCKKTKEAAKAIKFYKGIKEEAEIDLIIKTLDIGGDSDPFRWSYLCKIYFLPKLFYLKCPSMIFMKTKLKYTNYIMSFNNCFR